MAKQRCALKKITTTDVENYKQNVLEQSVLVSPVEAARILDCSRRKIYDLVRGGDLHGYNKRRRSPGLRLLASELRDYVQSIKIDTDFWRE